MKRDSKSFQYSGVTLCNGFIAYKPYAVTDNICHPWGKGKNMGSK